MRIDRTSLADIAERIASTEQRHSKLSFRIKRLNEEGSDASQEVEVLGHVANNLAQLYRTQATMRRTGWTMGASR